MRCRNEAGPKPSFLHALEIYKENDILRYQSNQGEARRIHFVRNID